MLLRPAWSHWDIWENTELGFSRWFLRKQYSAMRRSTPCAMRQIVLRF